MLALTSANSVDLLKLSIVGVQGSHTTMLARSYDSFWGPKLNFQENSWPPIVLGIVVCQKFQISSWNNPATCRQKWSRTWKFWHHQLTPFCILKEVGLGQQDFQLAATISHAGPRPEFSIRQNLSKLHSSMLLVFSLTHSNSGFMFLIW